MASNSDVIISFGEEARESKQHDSNLGVARGESSEEKGCDGFSDLRNLDVKEGNLLSASQPNDCFQEGFIWNNTMNMPDFTSIDELLCAIDATEDL